MEFDIKKRQAISPKQRKVIVPGILVLALITLVSAAYIAGLWQSATYTVTGKSNLTLISQWGNDFLNTVYSDANKTQTSLVYAANDNVDGYVLIEETDVLLDSDCQDVDWEDDCEFTYWLDEAPIINGSAFAFTAGNHNVSTNIYCEQLSCNSNRTTELTFVPNNLG